MNKEKYLSKLREVLDNKSVHKDDIDQIISDYDDLYLQGIEQGLSNEEIVNKLGDAKYVYNLLKDDLTFEKNYETNKFVAVSVFISLILFFVFGQFFNRWELSWLFFLLIPISAILINVKGKNKFPGLFVFLSIIVFYLFGMLYDLWHPLWLVFLSIPISGILISDDNDKMILGLSPFITTICYFIISYFYNQFYIIGWPVFLLIPLLGSFVIEDKKIRFGMVFTLLLAIISYYILSVTLSNWAWPLFVYIIPITYAIYTGQIEITTNFKVFKANPFTLLFLILIIAIYLLVSLITTSWAITWLILLSIPMILIYTTDKFKNSVSYTPFISIIIFYLVGYYIEGGFAYSWLAFFLIPITAILFNKEQPTIKVTTKNNSNNDNN